MALAPRIARQVTGPSLVRKEERRNRLAAAHVELVRQLPCAATLSPPRNDPHHLMRGVDRGTSLKAAGRYTIPLRHDIHMEITPHGDPEAVLMARYGVAARELADALWAVSGDLDAMTRVVERHHQEARRRAGNS